MSSLMDGITLPTKGGAQPTIVKATVTTPTQEARDATVRKPTFNGFPTAPQQPTEPQNTRPKTDLQLKPIKPLLTIQPKTQVQPAQPARSQPTMAVKTSSVLPVQKKPQQASKPLLSIQVPAKDKPPVQAASLSSMAKDVQSNEPMPQGTGLPVEAELCIDEGCPQHGTKHVCHNLNDRPTIYETGKEDGHAEAVEAMEAAEDFHAPTPELAHDRKQRLATQTKVEELTKLMKELSPQFITQQENITALQEMFNIQASNLQAVTQELEALKKEEPLD